jgi:hypothetical protein
MGKVGSDSIYNTLKECGMRNIYHVHYLYPETIDNLIKTRRNKISLFPILGYFAYNQLIKKKKRITIISLVREPIMRNVSAYFQNIIKFEGEDFDRLSVDQLIESFFSKYKHNIPLDWFDTEFKVSTGVDIYKFPFNKKKGYQIIESGNFRILLIKSEINDNIKEQVIEGFFKFSKGSVKIKRSNSGISKSYSNLYSEFKEKIKFSDDYIYNMKFSKYYKHFYE